MKTFASLFTGLGGADLGAIQAGLTPIWGVEKDYKIADQSAKNFEHPIYIMDVRKVTNEQWSDFGRLDWLHASPPCTTASQVNGKKESQEDIELAKSVCRAIETLKPEYFSLENVSGYWDYKSFDLIVKTLQKYKYHYDSEVLNAYDFVVPQSRKRLFLVASKNLFNRQWCIPKVEKKVSWYDAIADLIPTLKECNLTKSQKEVLINHPNFSVDPTPIAIQNSGSRKDKDGDPTNTIRLATEPIWTIRAMSGNVRPNPHQVTLIIDGKVLRPSIECYARWQSFPDSYQFSGDFKIDMKGIGNAVPPLMFSQIVRSVLS